MKKIICGLLAVMLSVGSSLPVFALELSEVSEEILEIEPDFSEEEAEDETEANRDLSYTVDSDNSLENTIREQVEAYAKSIDQPNANGKAADKLAAHGIKGGGKKLSANKSHPLTATLMNSGLAKDRFTDVLTAMVEMMYKINVKTVYGAGSFVWHSGEKSFNMYLDHEKTPEINNFVRNAGFYSDVPKNKLNSYDESLVWMGGVVGSDVTMKLSKVNKNTAVYKVDVRMYDRFDFSAENESTLGSLLGIIGLLLFEPFDWESKVSFQIEVPFSYNCAHGDSNYFWRYDPERLMFESVSENGFAANNTEKNKFTGKNGAVSYYHGIERSARLLHNKPWVMEITAKNPGNFVLSPFEKSDGRFESFGFYGKDYFYFQRNERIFYSVDHFERLETDGDLAIISDQYGIKLSDSFVFSTDATYKITVENKILEDGTNMPHISVSDIDKDEIMIESVPMSNRYRSSENGSAVYKFNFRESGNNYLSGKDFIINYLGSQVYRFSADDFEIKIWENGKDSEPENYFKKGKTTKPTCTEKGYTTYTCSLCGYSKKDNYKDAPGHSLGEWETVTAPTAENPGEEQRKCKNCDHSESRVIPALGYTLSDVNLDGSVDVMDTYFIRLIVAKLVEPTGKQIEMGDVDLDGKITAIDANIIRKYVIGIIKELPVA